jgi:hypothetical protein
MSHQGDHVHDFVERHERFQKQGGDLNRRSVNHWANSTHNTIVGKLIWPVMLTRVMAEFGLL